MLLSPLLHLDFPLLVGGDTNAPVVMVAEKAADMILGRPPLPALDVPAR